LLSILGPEAGARLKPIWGLDPEGEIQGVWRDLGIPRAWYMMGKFIREFLLSSDSNQEQGTLRCVGSTRSTLRCVRSLELTHAYSGSADDMTCVTEIKAIEEGIFDEKRYSLETPLE
jgi:hypothetical protein